MNKVHATPPPKKKPPGIVILGSWEPCFGAFVVGGKCLCGLDGKWTAIVNMMEQCSRPQPLPHTPPPADEKVQILDKMTWWCALNDFQLMNLPPSHPKHPSGALWRRSRWTVGEWKWVSWSLRDLASYYGTAAKMESTVLFIWNGFYVTNSRVS